MGRKRAQGRRLEELRPASPVEASDPLEMLIARARRSRRRGEARRELTLLREAATRGPYDARLHALLAAAATRAGQVEEGVRALRHARWLRARAGDAARAATLDRLLLRWTADNQGAALGGAAAPDGVRIRVSAPA